MSTSNWGPNICRQDDEWTCVSKMLLGFSLSRPILLGVLFRFKATIITIIIMIHNCYVIKLIHDDPFHFLPPKKHSHHIKIHFKERHKNKFNYIKM